jgi:predicted AlkP superfamily phosphohydrolase/phosphomutase
MKRLPMRNRGGIAAGLLSAVLLVVSLIDSHLAKACHAHSILTLAYIGPGAGFAFLGSFLAVVLSVLASLVSLAIWPFRILWLAARRQGRFGKTQARKVILLGLDGLDPGLTERWMEEGKLPNLARLRDAGSYTRLRTTFPPLSPVAWSTFATGVNPARHNIFDFLNRDLRNYAPELSSARVRPPSRFLTIFRWRIPLTRASVDLRRKSEPFWKILGRNAISSTILRVPITFPPEPFNGRLLSAMATPDLLGTQGSFNWFSTAWCSTESSQSDAVEGGMRLPLALRAGKLEGVLSGPDDDRLPFQLSVLDEKSVELSIQGNTVVLRLGEYSDWIRLSFRDVGPRIGATRGIARFLLTSLDPAVSLYVTPVEIDPENPALPISYPSYYAIYLAKLLGSFATLGMAEDTWALNEGAIDEDAFLKQAQFIQEEREAMFFSTLDRTKRGAVACVFDGSDRLQHMFYRYLKPTAHGPGEARHAGVIEDLYRDMDRLVGRTMKYVDSDTALFVLSDHGFCSFRRGVNLNSWLQQHGYLALKTGLVQGGEYFEGIDWSKTRAYTFGLSGIYLNIRGREAQGIVSREEARVLREELKAKLAGLRDEESTVAIRDVYDANTIYDGPYLDAAPDLIVGYAAGYRASWSAAVGKVSLAVFEDNVKRWSGDHCVDPSLVPGVLFSNRKLDAKVTGQAGPGIEDMAPTVLRLFGVEAPAWMEGRPLVSRA